VPTFVIIAAVIFFFVVKPLNYLMNRRKQAMAAGATAGAASMSDEAVLLSEIRTWWAPSVGPARAERRQLCELPTSPRDGAHRGRAVRAVEEAFGDLARPSCHTAVLLAQLGGCRAQAAGQLAELVRA